MSPTPDDGEVPQYAGEDDSHLEYAHQQPQQLPVNEELEELEELDAQDDPPPTLKDEDDTDLIPQLEADSEPVVQDLETESLNQPSAAIPTLGQLPPSTDDSASIPDDLPSIHGSAVSTPTSESRANHPTVSRQSSTASRRPFELRFQSRLSSSYLTTPRSSSPAFLGQHSRHSSLASFAHDSESGLEDSHTPWQVVRWARLKKLIGQVFSEAGRRNFGSPTCLAVTDQLAVGTSKGLVLIFDYLQNNKSIVGPGTKAIEAGSVTALAISADHTAIAVGHASGAIFTWDLGRPGRPFLHIPALDASQASSRKGDGHIEGSAVLHIGFLGYRRTALVSADAHGMAFSHLASRGTGAIARSVKTTRILGRYPDLVVRRSEKPVKKSSVLAFSPLPLGNTEQSTDGLGLVAMLTPYLLIVVSTTPIAQTQYKGPRPRDIAAHSAMTAALAWFPAIKLKGSDTNVSKNKLAYAWSNVLQVLEVSPAPRDPDTPEDKPVELLFTIRSRFEAEEAIVAIQWISRSVLAVLTITQQLLIVEDMTMTVTDASDLLPKNLFHADLYSRQLQSVIEHHDDDDASLHGVVADGYYMSFRGYKGRLFLLGFNDIWSGSLTNWADRLIAMMNSGNYIGAVRLATNYYVGIGEKVTIGLPEDDILRSTLVRDKLLEMMSASLRYAFGQNEQTDQKVQERQQLIDLAVVCVAACLKMDDKEYLFDEVFEWYDEHDAGPIFMDVIEPHILDRQIIALPPTALKILIDHFAQTHTPPQLEEIICLLDASTMDVDQVTSLCRKHNLWDAYTYVWNTALFDYTTPLLELLKIAQDKSRLNGHASVATAQQQGPDKVFAYLSFVLTGRVYPLGEYMEEERATAAKTQIYETLFLGKTKQSERLAVLQALLLLDAHACMAALNEAFEDSFLNLSQDDEDEMSYSPGRQAAMIDRQTIVRILLEMMSRSCPSESQVYLDMFIARNVPKYPQYMILPGSVMDQVFSRLCQSSDADVRDDAQLSLEYLMTIYRPANITHFIPSLQKSGFFRVLRSVYRGEDRWVDLLDLSITDPEDGGRVFELLLECLGPNSTLTAPQQQSFAARVRDQIYALARLDVFKTAKTADMVLSEFHSQNIDALSEEPYLQFAYLQVLLGPTDGSEKSSHTTVSMQERYIRLMCQYDSRHVIDYISVIKDTELELEQIMPALESSGNIDAAVVLLAQQGQIRLALNRLVKHLSVVEAALVGVLESAADSPDEVATNEAIEDLIMSIQKYAKVGIWLCETQLRESNVTTKKSTQATKTSIVQPLSFEEQLWLDFIVAVVSIAQKIGQGSQSSNHDMYEDELQKTLRAVTQQVFTALLSSTSTSKSAAHRSDPMQFVRILRAFLSEIADQSPSLSHLKHVMASVFSAYAYEDSLLSLANSILDKDLFVQLDEVTKRRQTGWRPRGQACSICRRRVWGPGTGIHVWQHWSQGQKEKNKRKEIHRRRSAVSLSLVADEDDDEQIGKGKRIAKRRTTEDDDDVDEGGAEEEHDKRAETDLGSIVVFSCRHLFHRGCLDQSQSPDSEERNAAKVNGQHDNTGMKLACPACQ